MLLKRVEFIKNFLNRFFPSRKFKDLFLCFDFLNEPWTSLRDGRLRKKKKKEFGAKFKSEH